MFDLLTISNYFNFFLVTLMVIIIVAILLFMYCRKQKTGDIPRNKMKLYGIMMNMNKKHILAISLVIINYLYLICGLIFYAEVNSLFVIITTVLTFLSIFLAYKFSYLIFGLISIVVNCLIILISNKVHEKLGLVGDNYINLLSYLILILGFAYYTLITIISANNIVNLHNIIRRKGNEKENK